MINKSIKQLDDNYKIITKTYQKINTKYTDNLPLVLEWLADNYYMLDQIIKELKLRIDAKLLKELNTNNELRLYNILYDLFSAADHVLNEQEIIDYLNQFQNEKELSGKEIWCAYDFSYMVQIDLIKDVCENINQNLESYQDPFGYEMNKLAERMGKCISQIRKIQGFNVKKLFDNVSAVERILLKDPAGCYENMEMSTKDYYRHLIEFIAKNQNLSELEVAKRALELSNSASDLRKRHIGYYIVSEPLGQSENKFNNKILYKWSNVLLSVFIYAIFAGVLFFYTGNQPLFYLISLLSLIPVTDIAMNLTNYLIFKISKPTLIPKMDLKDIEEKNTTAVVIPALVVNKNAVDDLVRKIEIYYVSNILQNVYFGLLIDLKEGKQEVLENDQELTSYLKEKISTLNNKYASKPFYALVRGRVYLASQKTYMGWERKRGALIEFTNLIKGLNTTFHYRYGSFDELKKVKYVITLDSDTHMGIGNVKRLIGAMVHPLNQPKVDHEKNRVVEGYGVIQPRVSTSLKSAYRSMFSKIFVGIGGFDPYSNTFSDIYQDNFHEGLYTGKGIFDVDIFHHLVDPLIRENTILSHDMLEGLIARAALATDIELTDNFPSKITSYFDRYHRWVRGDWQLIKWLGSTIVNKEGNKTKNPLSGLSKWKIIDNIRRSLVAPFSLILIILSVFYENKISLVIIFTVIFVYLFNVLTSLFDNIIYKDFKYINERNYNRVIYGTKSVLLRFCVMIVLIPYDGYLSIDAIIRTLYRLTISNKKMLEWTTSQEAEKLSKDSLSYYYIKMWICVVVAAFLILFRMNYFHLAFGVIFALSPFLANRLSLDIKKEKFETDIKDILFLRELLSRIWRFFDVIITSADHYLPPDNYQVNPYNGIAHRTSPTNIGLYLLCILGAYDVGFLKKEEVFKKIENTLNTIDQLEKYKGHLYNWYQTKTLEILCPRFISTVDSGNFIACLIALKEGLKEFEQSEAKTLVTRIAKIIEDTKFIYLYNKEKRLFTIGYNKDEDELSDSCYDLLASEARQTSYIAIANGEIDKRHWNTLGRSMSKHKNHHGLISWTGTMFEYLMPLLLIPDVEGSILNETYQFIVDGQIEYANNLDTLWGVSESGFYSFDINLNYQYKAFGIPNQGLKRGLNKEYVISPYSTILALMVRPKKALTNLKKLKEMNLYSDFGFYEAADFTKSRQSSSGRYEIVESYMAHHQGMSFLSIINFMQNNIFQKRFLRDIKMEAAKELIEEKISVKIVLSKGPIEKIIPKRPVENIRNECVRVLNPNEEFPPKTHIISNNELSFFIDTKGNNYLKFEDIYFNRFRYDGFLSDYGNYVYMKNQKSGKVYSLTYAPQKIKGENMKFIFSNDKAEIRSSFDEIDCLLSIGIGSLHDVLVYKLTLTNKSNTNKEMQIFSYSEIILSFLTSDLVHPAFNSLFLRTQYLEDKRMLYATKRPRNEGEREMNAIQFLISENISNIAYDTSRMEFLGRKNSSVNPTALETGLSRKDGAVLDPIFALGGDIVIEPNKSVKLYYVTAFTDDFDHMNEIYSNYDTPGKIDTNLSYLRKRAWAELDYIHADEIEQELYFDLLSNLIYLSRREQMENKFIPIEELWANGISGDDPIVLCEFFSYDNCIIAGQLVKAHEFLRMKGVQFDLILLVHEEDNYSSPNLKIIRDTISKTNLSPNMNTRGGVFILSRGSITEEGYSALKLYASVTLNSSLGSLRQQMDQYFVTLKGVGEPNLDPELPQPLEQEQLTFFNGYGGFNLQNEYIIHIKNNQIPPLPWINVLSNMRFGTITTESGGGFTFSENSRENKLTNWTNDVVTDPIQEVVYIKDQQYISTITPYPIHTQKDYKVVYGFGYTKYMTNSNDLYKELHIFVSENDPVKVSIVRLKNNSAKEKEISLYYYVKPVLDSNDRKTNRIYVHRQNNMLLFENQVNSEFHGRIAFVSSTEHICDFESDMIYFPGNSGIAYPNPVVNDVFSNKVGVGFEACGLIKVQVKIKANSEKEVGFLFGQVKDSKELNYIINKYDKMSNLNGSYEKTKEYWQKVCGKIQVKTEDKAFDALMNGWLIYQTLACRIFARAGFYQAGGAFGFRDQLQDSMALLQVKPKITRNQILRHSFHQFKEGDVQHWWHTKLNNSSMLDKGVRTRFSDDLLWLPYVTYEYIKSTGDKSILDEQMPFIDDLPLNENELEKYIVPKAKTNKESIFNHLVKALDKGVNFGEHGLPKIGSGDWNDGFSEVGKKGRGESVWLGWFLFDVLNKMVEICEMKERADLVEKYRKIAEELKDNLDEHAWEEDRYLRAFFDNGDKMGSQQSDECKIDAIAQAWAVISGAGKPEKKKLALESVQKYLVDYDHKIIKLLDPPFDKTKNNPGYIKSYVPGVRENGGQYTHGAIWVCLAYFLMGDIEIGYELFSMLNPINHSLNKKDADIYKTEPYAIAADIYSEKQNMGRGGWSWYTGAAGWYYKVGVETLLGIKKEGDTLFINPKIPSKWNGFEAQYHGHAIKVERENDKLKVSFDGKTNNENKFLLSD